MNPPRAVRWMCPCGCARLVAVAAVVVALVARAWITELTQFRTNLPGAQWVNWIGEFECGPDVAIERPTTLADLQSAVRKHASVRAAATGHSFNTFACPAQANGAVVDMRAFQRVEVSTPAGDSNAEVKVEAGITMGNLQNEILARGLTLRVPPGNPAYTVGGCIATGCHNLGQSHAQDLVALTFVLHNGTIREIHRGDSDFSAAAVSLGRLGIILDVTLQVLPYRSLQWSNEEVPVPEMPEIISILEKMSKETTTREQVGNKLVFYLATGAMMIEHWTPTGRAATLTDDVKPLPPYLNTQVFRLGQGSLSAAYTAIRYLALSLTPKWLLNLLQIPAETAFRGLHTAPALAKLRKVLGWQHSPEARGEGNDRPTGHQYTWAGFIDETMNLIMGLRHVEVIFPLAPMDRAAKCLKAVFDHRHLTWWRLNVRTMQSEDHLLSSVHSPAGSTKVTFLRVDFVSPGSLLDLPSGEASLTEQLHRDCPGWRKHWGKGLFKTSAEERWGDPKAFLEVATRWDPEGKFAPRDLPKWLS